MNKENFTSLKLSKLFAENGFKGESDIYWENIFQEEFILVKKGGLLEIVPHSEGWTYLDEGLSKGHCFPAYDLLWDCCIKYYKELFGEGREVNIMIFVNIIELLQQGKKEEAEEYLWEHCIINPKNKEVC